MIKNITTEFINAVVNCKSCTFSCITYVSDVKEIGKRLCAEFFGGQPISKVVTTQCQVNYSYEKAVNNRLEKAGLSRTFEADSLPFGEWKVPNKIITYKGVDYLRFYTYQGGKAEVTYFVGGNPATEEQTYKIKAILSAKAKPISAKQASEGLTANQVQPRCVKVESIISAVLNGETYAKMNP